jgi:hypothetical protein
VSIKQDKPSIKKDKVAISLNDQIDSLGTSRVYVYQKYTKSVKEYLYTPFHGKAEKVQKINDYIFGRSDESGLEEIRADFKREMKKIDKRAEEILRKLNV